MFCVSALDFPPITTLKYPQNQEILAEYTTVVVSFHFRATTYKLNRYLCRQTVQVMRPTFTLEQYKALKEAIVRAVVDGVLTVRYHDKQVTYRSLQEMKDALRMMEEELFPERFARRRKLMCGHRGYFTN